MEENENLTEEASKCVITTSTKECSFSCETIIADASRCPYCGESLKGRHLRTDSKRPMYWHEWSESREKRFSNYLAWGFYVVAWHFESLTLRIKQIAFFEILDYLSLASVLVAILFWFAASGEQIRQTQIQAWYLISLGEQNGGGVATVQALELLNCTSSFLLCNQVSLEGIKLEAVNLPQLTLPRAILKDAELNGANLSYANLSDAYLEEADLVGTNFSYATLEGSNLSYTDLRRAYLFEADLTGADLTGADLTGAYLIVADLEGAVLKGANLEGANLTGSNLTRADLGSAMLADTNLRRANLRRANLIEANLAGADLARASLPNAVMSAAILTGADLTEANLIRADLSFTDLSAAILADADLSAADLSGAKLAGSWYNAATNWPAGFEPVKHGALLSTE
jgi:uncharacterized protein YjbI with pentapeptide repeats